MSQRILISSTKDGSTARVQVGEWTAQSVTFATLEEAWHWAKTILQLRHEHLNHASTQQLAEELDWNKVL